MRVRAKFSPSVWSKILQAIKRDRPGKQVTPECQYTLGLRILRISAVQLSLKPSPHFHPFGMSCQVTLSLNGRALFELSFYTPALKQGRSKGLVEGIILLGSVYCNKILAIFQSWGSYRRKR